MTRDYELGFILNPEVSEEETRAILARIEQIVANHEGQIIKIDQWGRRRLAYPIEHHRDGFYIFIDMILTPETVIDIERTLRVSEQVLRHMTKKRDPKTIRQEREARVAAEAAAAAAAAAPKPENAAGTPEGEAPDETATATEGTTPATEEVPADASPEAAAPADTVETTAPTADADVAEESVEA